MHPEITPPFPSLCLGSSSVSLSVMFALGLTSLLSTYAVLSITYMMATLSDDDGDVLNVKDQSPKTSMLMITTKTCNIKRGKEE